MRPVFFAALLAVTGCVAPDAHVLERHRPSAVRQPGQSFEDALAQNRLDEADPPGDTPYDRQALLDDADLTGPPSWSREDLAAGFEVVRDTRFMFGVPPEQLARRASFLYPDDGCWARAQAMIYLTLDAGLPRPAIVFAFGELTVQTPDHPAGHTSWWYHLAPAVAVGRTVYVMDPSIDRRGPLALAEWVARQGDPAAIGVTVCHGTAFDPLGGCEEQPVEPAPDWVVSDEYGFLLAEWERQVALGRDPWSVLADSPPWGGD